MMKLRVGAGKHCRSRISKKKGIGSSQPLTLLKALLLDGVA